MPDCVRVKPPQTIFDRAYYNWDDPKTRELGVALTSEVMDWLEQQCPGRFRVIAIKTMQQVDQLFLYASGAQRYEIEFDRASDAVLFKLTWA